MHSGPDRPDDMRALHDFVDEHRLVPPVHSDLLPDADRVNQMVSEITALPQTPRRTRRRSVLLAVAAALLVLVVVAVTRALLVVPPSAAQDTPRMLTYAAPLTDVDSAPPAASVLQEAADVAAAAAVSSSAGDVQYVSSYGWLLSVDSTEATINPTTTDQWLMPDGSLRIDQHRGVALNIDGSIKVSDEPDPSGSTDTAPPGTLDPDLPATLPRDPTALSGAMISAFSLTGCETTQTQCLITAIEDLHTTYVVPPDLASAVWQALALEPEVTSLGDTTDRFGTPVMAVATPALDPDTEEVLLISRQTGQLTGTETITMRSDDLKIQAPTVTAFTSIRTGIWVQQAGAVS